MDLVAFKAKAKISPALHHVSEAELVLSNMECSSQGLVRSLRKARPSPEEGLQDKH